MKPVSSIIDNKVTGTVFNIQKFSVHDGPGIRTIVFLKGCPLRCKWCSNPESQKMAPEVAYNKNNCLGVDKCVRCIDACANGAVVAAEDGKISIDRELCGEDFACADACPARALVVYGEEASVDEALKRVEEDGIFYARSGGGLTLSGGEPFMQPMYALALLREARRRHIDTAVETSGQCDPKTLDEVLPFVNMLMYDIKCMDSEKHKELTGCTNERILKNLAHVREKFPNLPLLVRTPVIPGCNDTEEEVTRIIDFLRGLPGDKVGFEVLEYHRMGQPKYDSLGVPYPLDPGLKLDAETFGRLKQLADAYNKEPA